MDAQHPWGSGAGNRALAPFRSVAVDPSVLVIGHRYWVMELDGVLMPGDGDGGGFVHDGCVSADDTGGSIDGLHIDFFSALRAYYRELDGALGLDDVTLYDGGERCRYRAIGDFSFELEDLEVTLTPDGPLIDGHDVRPITARPAAGRDQIDDVPIGRYTVRVSHPAQGPLLVRVRNHGEPAAQATVLFAAPFPGSSRYGLELEVKGR